MQMVSFCRCTFFKYCIFPFTNLQTAYLKDVRFIQTFIYKNFYIILFYCFHYTYIYILERCKLSIMVCEYPTLHNECPDARAYAFIHVTRVRNVKLPKKGMCINYYIYGILFTYQYFLRS